MQIADLGNFLDEEQRTFNDYIYNKPKYFFFCKLLITFFFWGLLMEGLTWTVALEKYRLQQAEEIEKKYELAQIVNKKLTKGIGRYKLVQEHNVRAISACAEVRSFWNAYPRMMNWKVREIKYENRISFWVGKKNKWTIPYGLLRFLYSNQRLFKSRTTFKSGFGANRTPSEKQIFKKKPG